MKTKKQVPVELVMIPKGEFMPEHLEFGKIYYSHEYEVSCHLCLCGCGVRCCIPITEGEWSLWPNKGKVSIAPSLQQRFECKSHYIISNGKANFV